MNPYHQYPTDRVIGEVLDKSNWVLLKVPAVASRFAGNNLLVRWRHAPMGANEPGLDWERFEPSNDSGVLPAQYRELAVFSFDRDQTDAYKLSNRREGAISHAVAYVLGKNSVMVGTSAVQREFAVDPRNGSNYALAMGIGRGVLRALPGLRMPEGHFHALSGVPITVERMRADALPTGIPKY